MAPITELAPPVGCLLHVSLDVLLDVLLDLLPPSLRRTGSVEGVLPSSTDPGDTGGADVVDHHEIDLAAIEAELDDVQAALTRLSDGTYWTDEVSGAPIPDEILADTPLARRA